MHTGPKVGAFLNSTLGNAAELIIATVALKSGQYTLVKASLAGSILGNLLLVLGLGFLLGGFKNGRLRYDRTLAGVNSNLLLLAVVGLIIPTLLIITTHQHTPGDAVQALNHASDWVAGFLIVLYILGMVFTFTKDGGAKAEHSEVEAHSLADVPSSAGNDADPEGHHVAEWSVKKSISILVVVTGCIVVLSELLVGAIEPVVKQSGISELFIGIILLPIVGNVAENIVAVRAALKNQMNLSLGIAMGSSTQIALFVAPALVLLSLVVGPSPMDLHFTAMEVGSLAMVIANFISLDGESNWLEGAMLLGLYGILAVGFFYAG